MMKTTFMGVFPEDPASADEEEESAPRGRGSIRTFEQLGGRAKWVVPGAGKGKEAVRLRFLKEMQRKGRKQTTKPMATLFKSNVTSHRALFISDASHLAGPAFWFRRVWTRYERG